MNLSPKALLVQLLTSPQNSTLLDESRRRAREIISFLETVESEDELPIDLEQLDPAWVAEVYEALSDDDVLSPEEQTQASALEHATESEEERIGRAFKNDLLAHLPAKLRSFHHFRELDRPELTPADWKDLRESTTVRAAGSEAEPLLQYGLTPLTVFLATEAVARLSERLLRHGLIPAQEPITFVRPNHHIDVRPALLKSDALMTRITDLTGCEPLTAHCLLSWLLDVALYKPYLFRWFKVSPILEGVRLDQIGDDYTELDERWGLLSEFVAVGERLAAHACNPVYAAPRSSKYRQRRSEMREAITNARYRHPSITSWDLIVLADHYPWPAWAIECLPELYLPLEKFPDGSERALLWRKYRFILKDKYEHQIIDNLCKEIIYKVLMPKETAEYVHLLVDAIEPARQDHPFPSEGSVDGTFNQAFNDLELLAKAAKYHEVSSLTKKDHNEYLDDLLDDNHLEYSDSIGEKRREYVKDLALV